MSKIDEYDLSGQPQEVIDFADDVRTIINFGKYQPQVVSATPTWVGRRGEFVWVFGTSGALVVCTSDGTTIWRGVVGFTIP